MVHNILIGGKKRKLLFGNYLFRKLKEEHDISLSDVSLAMSNGDASLFPLLIYSALRTAELSSGDQQETYDVDTVCLWMDERGGVTAEILPWLLDAIKDMVGHGAKIDIDDDGTDDTKKKNRG